MLSSHGDLLTAAKADWQQRLQLLQQDAAEKLTAVESALATKIDALRLEVEKLDTRQDKLDTRQDKLDARQDKLDTWQDKLDKELRRELQKLREESAAALREAKGDVCVQTPGIDQGPDRRGREAASRRASGE